MDKAMIFVTFLILALVSCRDCLSLGKQRIVRKENKIFARDHVKTRDSSQFHLLAASNSNTAANLPISSTNQYSSSDPSNMPPYTLSKPQKVYVAMTTLFVTCLVIADVIGMKIFEVKLPFPILGFTRIEHTCGMLTFPVTFLLSDIINEYFGAKATKSTVYLGLSMSMFVFFIINVATALPFLDKPFNSKSI
jgi:hypothetical protein